MVSMNQGRPCAARLVRTGNRLGSAAWLAGSAKPDTSTARSRQPCLFALLRHGLDFRRQHASDRAAHNETIYLVSRTEQARDRRIAAARRWIVEAVAQAK
jgi:hypothetical protein